MIEKYTINNSILSILINRIHEEDLPINITTGKRKKMRMVMFGWRYW